jgi:hypothetical protein
MYLHPESALVACLRGAADTLQPLPDHGLRKQHLYGYHGVLRIGNLLPGELGRPGGSGPDPLANLRIQLYA